MTADDILELIAVGAAIFVIGGVVTFLGVMFWAMWNGWRP